MDLNFPYHSGSRFLSVPEPGPGAGPRPYAIAGVAYDGATTNRPGARFGPSAIRVASRMLCDAVHPWFGVTPVAALADVGDLSLPVTSLAAQRVALLAAASALIQRHHVCWLGGDHSITLPLLRAHRALHNRPLALLHFDAHCDTWDEHGPDPSGHGTWVREALAEGLVEGRATVQVGIRSAAAAEAREYVTRAGGRSFSARELRGCEGPAQLAFVADEFRHRWNHAGRPPAYLTLDIDCLDPAFAPGTGTPEPGGLSTAQVLTLLEVLHDIDWTGMDCVEVAPPYDHAELTSLAAAHFVWTYLCGRIARGTR